jgi:glycosyltransferase involved in cell wall biosynthesis
LIHVKIGIVSPFLPKDVMGLLDDPSRAKLAVVKGSTATPVTPLVHAWHAQGHEISVFCLDPSIASPCRLSGERLSIHVLPKRRFRQSAFDFYRLERQRICEAVQVEGPQVLSAQWSYEHALGALDTGLPTVVTCHDTPLRYAWISKNLFMAYHLLVAAAVFRRARHLIAVSPYTAGHIRRYFSPRADPVVIPNGLPAEIFLRGERRLQPEPDHSGTFTICSVGGWGRIKNVTALLRAYDRIRKEQNNVRLVLFGSGLGPDQEAERWALKRNLAGGVEFKGKVSRAEILDFLERESDLMIHPSLIECHPMVLIEAVACGVPVLAGAESGGVAWTLGGGRYGRLCDVTNPESIAAAALSIMTPQKSPALSPRDAWHGIRQQCGIETVATRTADLLASIRD